ncbi:MAG: hypothetical protein OEW62_01960 [Candidatus Bathyarchaeota archaeon]|nr:hypothetical protein [Candidatus Bathyarchaeota archaeon]
MAVETRIPKKAVEPLILLCGKLGRETGRQAEEVFKEFLVWMKKYAWYFFGEPWSEKAEKQVMLSGEDVEFVERSESYGEECERFALVCLRRNMSLKGFDVEGFDRDFEFFGRILCGNCSVWRATGLRRFVERVEQKRRENEEEMKGEDPSWITREMYEYRRRPDVVRLDKMRLVELRFYEEVGGAKGKSCLDRNKYRCPYGDESERFVEDGELIYDLWRLVEWYDRHWNRSRMFQPSPADVKWCHYDEASIIDVTSYEDVLKAAEDGRLKGIFEEHERYLKETRSED